MAGDNNTIAINLRREDAIRSLVGNLYRNLSQLQIAILRENKYEIGNYLGSALEQSHELQYRLSEITSKSQ